jgi:hypothetical protein
VKKTEKNNSGKKKNIFLLKKKAQSGVIFQSTFATKKIKRHK